MSTPVSYYVYRHVRPDTNVPFYIGIGRESDTIPTGWVAGLKIQHTIINSYINL